jgi:hypothetical protein
MSSNHQDDETTRFSSFHSKLEPQRIMLDVSQIPVGQLCDQQDTFLSDKEILGNMVDLQADLLAEESTLRLSDCDSA